MIELRVIIFSRAHHAVIRIYDAAERGRFRKVLHARATASRSYGGMKKRIVYPGHRSRRLPTPAAAATARRIVRAHKIPGPAWLGNVIATREQAGQFKEP